MNLLGIANPKQKAIEIVQTGGAPTGFFEPGSLFFWLTIIFFLLSAIFRQDLRSFHSGIRIKYVNLCSLLLRMLQCLHQTLLPSSRQVTKNCIKSIIS